MKMKKHSLHLYATIVLLMSFIGIIPLATSTIFAEEMNTEKTKDTKLAVPQNVRVEDGFIVWDEVENAYGYTLKTTVNGNEIMQTCYENKVEINRFFYERQNNYSRLIDFGNYDFMVCAFDESNVSTEYSAPVTVSYTATFTIPTNVRLTESQNGIQFDEVEGAVRYNYRIFNDDADRSLYTQSSSNSNLIIPYTNKNINYWISVQAMDRDYHVSEWTEPIAISISVTENLEAPKNLHLDETGENILWDAVEGADYYYVYFNFKSSDGSTVAVNDYQTTEARYDNWKSIMCPFSDGNVEIYVNAHSMNGYGSSSSSDPITASFKLQRDESIPVPESLRFEDGRFQWDTADCTRYWMRIWINEYLWKPWNVRQNYNYHIGNELPAGSYEVELFIIDENNNYNSQSYSVTLNTIPDETVWTPKIYYKFTTLLWDWDRLRHDKTSSFWIRLKNEKTNDVVILKDSWSEYFYGLTDLSNGEYAVDVCVYEYNDKLGNWSEPLHISKHDNGLFDKENESSTDVELPPEAENVPEEDRITSITINPAFNMKHKNDNNVEIDLSKIKIKAKEVYDEDGLKRASEALGETISGNKHYNLMDLTLLYKEEDFSNSYEGLVQVIIPLPKGHRDKTFSCYRLTEINGKMTKEVIPGEQTADSYIIYLEHFSEYALVADGGEESHTHAFSDEWKSDGNNHWKECQCGIKSEETTHSFGDWNIIREATINEEGTKERSCTICNFKQTENIPKIANSNNDNTNGDINNTDDIDDNVNDDIKPEQPYGQGSPNTGDYTPIKLYMMLIIITGFTCLAYFKIYKKNGRNNYQNR